MDFCDREGKAVDTIILAGENGNGKSTIINELFGNISGNNITTMAMEIETEGDIIRIENKNGRKVILFKKNNEDIPIDNLSSGEKQIVYRGCFLLKDVNALHGAFVFLDEPEISLHPSWQAKIMNYYKNIFTDKNGIQTSQIFVVTHSPFIIHNDSRKNDKVIVLTRDKNGEIVVKEKAEYYKCNSIELVQDAFYINDFNCEKPTVFLEGRTDEKYFDRALEIYAHEVPFQFKWVGYVKEDGNINLWKLCGIRFGLEFMEEGKHR